MSSSKAELLARSVKRFQKRQARAINKGFRPQDPENSMGDYIDTMLPIPKKRTCTGVLPRKNKGDIVKSEPKTGKNKNPTAMRKTADQLKTDFSDSPPFEKNFWLGEEGDDEPSDELKAQRKEIGVLVKGNLKMCPAPVMTIQSSSLPKSFAKVCASHGVTKPSPVQMQCWPPVLYGANVLGIAPTGSGKTLAFCLPIVPHVEAYIVEQQKVHAKRKFTPPPGKFISPIALILVPTRELALQVVSVLKPMKRLCGITSGAVYGGLDKNEQLQKLKASCSEDGQLHVLVATPGRLEDFLYTASAGNSVQLEVSRVTYLVIDEADRMLTMGFMEQLDAISNCIRPDRQTLLFSATFPGRLREASEGWVKDAVIVRCSAMEFQDHSKAKPEAATEALAATADADQDEVNSDDEAESSDEDEEKESPELADGEEAEAPKAKKVKFDAAVVAAAEDGTPVAAGVDKTSSLTISHTVQQKIHVCASHKKPRLLLKYITTCRETEKAEKVRQAGPMIIFCNKIKTLKFVHDFLKRQNIRADALHGQLAQHVRESILANFKAVRYFCWSFCIIVSYVFVLTMSLSFPVLVYNRERPIS
jgi:superfamily II DNA/RNA helicase